MLPQKPLVRPGREYSTAISMQLLSSPPARPSTYLAKMRTVLKWEYVTARDSAQGEAGGQESMENPSGGTTILPARHGLLSSPPAGLYP